MCAVDEKQAALSERGFPVLPTMFTLGNAFCGFASITYAARVGPDVTVSAGAHLQIAAMYLFLAMFFDMLDGSIARWTNQTSEFGAQLDSLCDAVSFGVAPAFLTLQSTHSYHPRLLWMIAAIYIVCGVLRLARFNVEADEKVDHHEASKVFSGLPTPAAAGVIAAFPIARYGLPRLADPDSPEITHSANVVAQWLKSTEAEVLPIVTLVLACLMVSRVPYLHVFNAFLSGRRNYLQTLRLVFIVIVLFAVREMALLVVFGAYAFYSPVRMLWLSCCYPKIKWARRFILQFTKSAPPPKKGTGEGDG